MAILAANNGILFAICFVSAFLPPNESKKFYKAMDLENRNPFSCIKEENGMRVIDIEKDLDKYEILSLLFHKETAKVDTSKEIAIVRNDKKRYFEDTTICYNCGEIGHVSRDCKVVKERRCMYCDIQHEKAPCDFILCDNCMCLGHSTRYCRDRMVQPEICKECPLQYHYADECPRVWRRYKFKKHKNAPEPGQIQMSCPYCQSTDHFMDDCESKDRKFTIFTKHYSQTLSKKH